VIYLGAATGLVLQCLQCCNGNSSGISLVSGLALVEAELVELSPALVLPAGVRTVWFSLQRVLVRCALQPAYGLQLKPNALPLASYSYSNGSGSGSAS
jgi:hypothetical protein